MGIGGKGRHIGLRLLESGSRQCVVEGYILGAQPCVQKDIIKEVYFVYFVYYESIKRELKIRGIYECRCDERLIKLT